MRRRHQSRARGFLFADVMIGLALMVMIAVALVSAKSAYARFDRKLAEQRTADRMAEAVLVDLQRGRPLPEGARLVQLDTDAPGGLRWVTVEMPYNGRIGKISGLVRRAS